MKKLFTIIILSILMIGCIKNQPVKEIEPNIETRVSGLLPDNPKMVALVPLLVSKNFLKIKQTSEIAPALRGKPVRDRIPPTVAITSPSNGSVVDGVVNINTTASDNVGVASVTLTINGAGIATLTTAPYNFTWNATNVASGTYTITATARDNANNSASYSISVVKNGIVVEPPVDTTTITYEMKTPPVGNQGSEGSCAAWSTGYAARSIDWFYKTGASSFSNSVNVFSPEFLYNQVKFSDDCNSGTAMQTALDFIKVNGISTWDVMPYESGNCATLPDAQQQQAALPYKIAGYYKIYTSDTAMIKSMVRANKAVIISIVLDNNFLAAKSGFIWKNTGSPFGIGHSVVITGYSESLKAWKIMNSFGTAWGTNGFAYMEYDMFPTRTGTWCYVIN